MPKVYRLYQTQKTSLAAGFVLGVWCTVVRSRRGDPLNPIEIFNQLKFMGGMTMKTAVVRSANVTRQKAVCLQWILLNILHAPHRTRVILQRRLCIINQTSVNAVNGGRYLSKTASRAISVFVSHCSFNRSIFAVSGSGRALLGGSLKTFMTASTVTLLISKKRSTIRDRILHTPRSITTDREGSTF